MNISQGSTRRISWKVFKSRTLMRTIYSYVRGHQMISKMASFLRCFSTWWNAKNRTFAKTGSGQNVGKVARETFLQARWEATTQKRPVCFPRFSDTYGSMKQDTMLYQDRLGTRQRKAQQNGVFDGSRSACCKHYVANSVEHSTEDGMTWCEKRASFWRNFFTYMNDRFTKTGSGQT